MSQPGRAIGATRPGTWLVSVAMAVACVVPSQRVRAQDECGCDHVIDAGTGGVDGTELGIEPGDVVCLMAGAYPYIRFREIRGSEDAPIVIKNCGGVVDVANSDRGYGVDFQGSSAFFHFTGTGDPTVDHGIRISASRRGPDYPGMGLWFLDKSTNYEADHIEVHDVGFAGVMAKTDPLCDGSADQGTFTQENVRIHHMWVHHTGGEGFYVGSTQANGQTINCDGASVTRQPHYLEGIELDHNLVEDTEWDGMQVGMARAGCAVHDNVIRRVGSADEQYQQQVLQIGSFSRCDVRRNRLSNGPQMGVIVLDSADTLIADNVIAHVGEDGIYANLRSDGAPASYRMLHNTIVDFGGAAIRVFGPMLTESAAINNLVIGDSADVSAGNDVDWTNDHNVFAASESASGFLGAEDFHLDDDSPARGAGLDLTGEGFALDFDQRPRAMPPAAGAYEVADDVPNIDAGVVDDAGPVIVPDAGAPTTKDKGCGCDAVGSGGPRRTWPGLFSAVLGLGWIGRMLRSSRAKRRG